MSNRKVPAGRSRLGVGVPLAAGVLAVATLPTGAMPAAAVTVTNVGCGSTAGASLVTAIAAANAATGAQILSLASGCDYVLTKPDNHTYGPSGTPVIANTIAIRGNGATISRSGATGTKDFRILTVGPGGQLAIDSVTITNGLASCEGAAGSGGWCSQSFYGAFGGGIGVVGGSLDVVRSKLNKNTASCQTDKKCDSAGGGAIGSVPAPVIPNVTPALPSVVLPSVVTITESWLSANTAACADDSKMSCFEVLGGAVEAVFSDLHVTASGFHHNSASCTNTGGATICDEALGGGIGMLDEPDPVDISDSELDYNAATADLLEAAGGAIVLEEGEGLALAGTRVHDNTATDTGTAKSTGAGAVAGGIVLDDVEHASIAGGSVDHNSATGRNAIGGGVVAEEVLGLSMSDLPVSDNSATATEPSGVAAAGGALVEGADLHAARTHFDENSVTGGKEALGGGLITIDSVTVLENGSANRNQVKANKRAYAGGIFSQFDQNDSLLREEVAQNSVNGPDKAWGGGVLLEEESAMSMQDSRILQNRVVSATSGQARGGGIYSKQSLLGVLGASEVVNNTASAPSSSGVGGGIFARKGAEVDPPSTVNSNTPDQCAPAGKVVGC